MKVLLKMNRFNIEKASKFSVVFELLIIIPAERGHIEFLVCFLYHYIGSMIQYNDIVAQF